MAAVAPVPQEIRAEDPELGTVAQLKGLKELLDGGVLTKEEFDAEKTVILEKSKITQVKPAPVVGQQPMWADLPPPNESASSWWGMYKPEEGSSKIGPDGRFTRGQEPDDCGNCTYAFFAHPAPTPRSRSGPPMARYQAPWVSGSTFSAPRAK